MVWGWVYERHEMHMPACHPLLPQPPYAYQWPSAVLRLCLYCWM